MSWNKLGPVLSVMNSLGPHDFDKFDLTKYHLQFLMKPEVKTNLNRIKNAVRQAQAGRKTLQTLLEHKEQAAHPTELLILLRHARNYQASDQRDLIYAFLDLADPIYAITPNYASTNSIVDVLIDAAKRIVLSPNGIEILHDALSARGQVAMRLPGSQTGLGKSLSQIQKYKRAYKSVGILAISSREN
jgi:hypothetical protein